MGNKDNVVGVSLVMGNMGRIRITAKKRHTWIAGRDFGGNIHV